MLATLRKFLSDHAFGGGTPPRRFEDNDYRTAAAALLIHVMTLDGAPSAIERARLESVLAYRFTLGAEAVQELISAATRAEGDALDLSSYTRVIHAATDHDGRVRIIEMVWELIFADRKVTEFEDSVVERVAELLEVTIAECRAAKQRMLSSIPADTQ